MKQIGTCHFCGQQHFVAAGEESTEEQLDYLATLECDCERAQDFAELERKKNQAWANIDMLFENEGDSIKQMLKSAAESMLNGNIAKLSLTSSKGVKCSLSFRGSSVKAERTETEKKSLET